MRETAHRQRCPISEFLLLRPPSCPSKRQGKRISRPFAPSNCPREPTSVLRWQGAAATPLSSVPRLPTSQPTIARQVLAERQLIEQARRSSYLRLEVDDLKARLKAATKQQSKH